MTIDFSQYVKDGNLLDMYGTTTCKTLRNEELIFSKKNPDIEKVNVNELINFINENPNITKLNFPDCNSIPENNINISLAKLIENCKLITDLNISGNNLGLEINVPAKVCNITPDGLSLSANNIRIGGVGLIAEALEKNTTLTTLDLSGNGIGVKGAKEIDTNLKADIETKLQRNKEIKDISESFKAIISKITLGSDGTLSWDEEGSKPNSLFNKLEEYNGKYGAFPTTVLGQIIAKSIYQNTVHVYKDGTEQLSFAAISAALTELSKSLIFDNKEAFISKIAGIINEAKEMFMLELGILNVGNALVPEQNESSEGQQLSDTSDTQSDPTILGDNIYPEMQYS